MRVGSDQCRSRDRQEVRAAGQPFPLTAAIRTGLLPSPWMTSAQAARSTEKHSLHGSAENLAAVSSALL